MVCDKPSTVFPRRTSIITLAISPPSSGCFLLCSIPPMIIITIDPITTTIAILLTIQTTAQSPTNMVIQGTASVCVLE